MRPETSIVAVVRSAAAALSATADSDGDELGTWTSLIMTYSAPASAGSIQAINAMCLMVSLLVLDDDHPGAAIAAVAC